ncbi:MFS transporter [Rhodococcus sp. IEGM 1354]|uniref:MFS transporter n=1 Tax=Rhodococcus sp. IEGM 1354 TaxID=3047088 RepID=UPI0024B843C2|nr:MFS transporter [Rhodococcus sp. IEGM 1354]MDI9928969.1 MFS transporter [Rhodococcus sp. IEGM 1354]
MNDASFRTRLRESPGVGKLTTVRFAGQFGDGLFQAALSGAILFNPERATNPAEIAAGFAVLLVPYSLVGPFAGALLDRWDRRSVLLWANIVRIVLITATAGLLFAGVDATPLLLLALATVGLSRFVLAGASASLPHVVRQSWLVPMNSVLATVGSGFAAAGAGLAVAVIGTVGAGDLGSGVAVGLAATGSVVGAVAAARFAPRSLGPDTDDRTDNPLKDVAAGLKSGALAVWRSPGVTTAMIGIGAHRIVFGINTLIMVLVLRESTQSSLPGGLAGFGIAVGATATGMFLAAVIAPFAVPRFGRTRTIATALVLAIAAQVGAVSGLTQTSLLLGAFLLGIAGQTVKLSGDAAMQIEIDDAHRGRVFALQDTVFNVAFVGALAAAAFAVGPDATELSQDPTAHELVFVGAGIYAVGFLAAILDTRRAPR